MKKLLLQFPEAEQHLPRIETLCAERLVPVLLPLRPTQAEFLSATKGAEAAFGFLRPDWLSDTNIRWLHTPSAGADMYIAPCREKDILLTTSANPVFGSVIAEHAVALLFSLARRIPSYVRHAEACLWQDAGSEWDMEGRTACILGTGNLGTELAHRLKAMGMVTVGVCRSRNTPKPEFDRIVYFSELDSLLPAADAVFGCLPSTPDTLHLLDESRLARMKRGSILVNVGRGNLIDMNALTKLAVSGHFFGIGLDVTEPEPLPVGHPLWSLENTIITPHIAGVSIGHLPKMADAVWHAFLENLRRYCNGEAMNNIVDLNRGY